MSREYIIFSSSGSGNGAARIEKLNTGCRVSIDVDGYTRPKKDEVIKAYLIDSYMPGSLHLLGTMQGGRESFAVEANTHFKGIAILNKNVNSGDTVPVFWGSRKGQDIDFDELFTSLDIKNDEEEKKIDSILEIPAENTENTNVEDINVMEEQEKMDGFESFGGGKYEWHKVKGFYGLYSFDVIKHILSIPDVKAAINERGFYYTGVKEEEDTKYIIVAVPAKENPFKGHEKYVTPLTENDTLFYLIACGIDSLGEFFLKPE